MPLEAAPDRDDLSRLADDGCPNAPPRSDDSTTFDLSALWGAAGGD